MRLLVPGRHDPVQAFEPGEVTIERRQRGALIYSDRRQVRVRNEVPNHVEAPAEFLEKSEVVVARRDRDVIRVRTHRTEEGERIVGGRSYRKDAPVRDDAYERCPHD